MTGRRVPLILIASESATLAEQVAEQLRRDGNVVTIAHSAEGCLRVATSIGPDLILVDPSFSPRIEHLLKGHPVSSRAEVLHLSDSVPRPTYKVQRAPAKAGPHAA